MLENITLNQALAFFFSAAGIAIILQRVPKWDAVHPDLKKLIVIALNLLAPGALAAVQAYVPAGAGDQTVANLIIGGFMAAAAFVIHFVDEWLKAQAAIKKLQAGIK